MVKKEYSDPDNIATYMKVDLWPSEERIISSYFSNGPVLDLGCGAGRAAIALARKGFSVTGVDIVPGMMEIAKKQSLLYKVDVEYKVMDARALSFPDGSFQNVLFSFNGFEHISGKENRSKVLDEVYRVLKPGGCFVLTARSGFAFGKRWIAWMWMCLRHAFLKPLGLSNPNLKFGDMIFGGSYHHYLSPFRLRKMLKETGFLCEFFNSKRNIENNKSPSFLTNFSSDTSLFYVARKPLSPISHQTS